MSFRWPGGRTVFHVFLWCARVRVMNDDNGELPSFGLGGPIDASRAQKQIEQDIERRTVRHMLVQALSNWRKTKRGRPKAQ